VCLELLYTLGVVKGIESLWTKNYVGVDAYPPELQRVLYLWTMMVLLHVFLG
jgi:hypothetical protein